ncbi:DMT family transporter [Streptomyces glomeratus]|uniref:DMT family transporter n=1 Tax=Streptomyces glomeratus TaxID=284452 RepID=A0ABP6M0X5_9ACTN|nr:DMT family transporter [Streptomyces glomeratus]MCF1508901.1 DMT family transporter [Streptomyces glomeratus]
MDVLTYLLSVLAACANAVSSVLQRKANREMPPELALRPKLILELLRQPVWLAGVAGVIIGFLLQAAALDQGELSVVEPILVCELPLTLFLAAWVFHAPLRLREAGAAVGMAAGLAGLLFFLAPSAGQAEEVPWYAWLLASVATMAATAAAFEWARRGRIARDQREGSARRAAGFGMAAGCTFGLTAAFIKAATVRYNEGGLAGVFTGWELYCMVIAGVLGMFLLQSAMHAGRLVAAQPALTLSDPLVSVLWGVTVFGEIVRGGLYLLLATASGVLLAASVVVLSRSPAIGEKETRHVRGG